MGFFSKIKDGLKKTKESMVKKMQKVVNSFTKIDEELFEQLEETMIMSDMGVETSVQICEELRKRIKERGIVYEYETVQTETVDGRDVEAMELGSENNWDLTLFTCTLSGQSRVTVRAVQTNN